MGKRGSAGGKRHAPSVASSAGPSNYGSIIDMSSRPGATAASSTGGATGSINSSSAGTASNGAKGARAGDKTNIWEEYYPLIQPAHQYHQNGRGASNYFFHGMFSSDVLCAYRDAVLAYLVALFSMVVLSITGLVFCKEWGLAPTSPVVFACRSLWTVSPAVASFALRNSCVLALASC